MWVLKTVKIGNNQQGPQKSLFTQCTEESRRAHSASAPHKAFQLGVAGHGNSKAPNPPRTACNGATALLTDRDCGDHRPKGVPQGGCSNANMSGAQGDQPPYMQFEARQALGCGSGPTCLP
mmetsp:Transcript_105252/g.181499  ORF Transcript_105252/g.181499 Transcript_105252/m.181499 type:complete len:121 (-) Transcript_105252:1461-1823(-)